MNRSKLRIVAVAAAALAAAAAIPVAAQLAGQTIRSFRLPEYKEDGSLQWVFTGKEATFQEDGSVHIEGAQVDFYRGERIDMIVRAPTCEYHQEEKRASTDGRVDITAPNMTIRGVGMDWNSAESKMKLHSNVRVTILNPKEGIATDPPDDEEPEEKES